MSRWVSATALVAAMGVAGFATSMAFAQPAPAPAQPAPANPAQPARAPVVTAPAQVDPAQAMVDGWVEALNATDNTIAEYESIDIDGDTIVVNGLTILNRLTRDGVQFDAITLTGFEEQGPGFAFDELTVDHISGRSEGAVVEIVGVLFDNVVLPDAGFTFDPEHPFTSALDIFGMIAAISVDDVTVGRIDVSQDQGGLNSLTTYHNYHLEGWADGRVALATSGPVIIESPSPDGLLSMTVGRIETRDTDLAAIPFVFAVENYENGVGNPEWRSVVGSASYTGLQVTAPGLQMRIREISLEDFQVRQSDRPIADLLDQLIVNGERPNIQLETMAGEAIIDFLTPFGIGRFAIDGVDIYAEGLDRFHLGEFHIEDLSLDGLGEIGFSDLDVIVGGEGWARVEQFAFGDIVAPTRDILREAILTGVDPEDINAVAALIPQLGYIELGGLEFGEEGMLPFTLARFQAEFGGFIGGIPTGYRFEVADFGAPLTLLSDDIRRILGQLGYTQATADLTLDVAWDEASETLLLKDLYLALDGAGSIRANLRISGVTRQMLLEPADADLDQIALAGGEIVVTDETVADRLFAWTAEGTDQPAAQYREEFIRGLPFLMSVMMDRNIAAAIAPAIQEFLRQPGTMTITLAPPEPVVLNEIDPNIVNDVGALIELLGVTITTTTQ